MLSQVGIFVFSKSLVSVRVGTHCVARVWIESFLLNNVLIPAHNLHSFRTDFLPEQRSLAAKGTHIIL